MSDPNAIVPWRPTAAQVSRLAALTEHLRGLGFLAGEWDHLAWADSGGEAPNVTIEPADPAAQAEIDAWDWSEAADVAHRQALAKEAAKAAFADVEDATATAARNADRALYRSIIVIRAKINELVAWANAQGAAITPMTSRTFAQAMAGAAALVDAETDPAGD